MNSIRKLSLPAILLSAAFTVGADDFAASLGGFAEARPAARQ